MNHLNLFEEFVDNFNNNLIENKMSELSDLINSFSDGQNLIYEWENKNEHQILINFTTDNISIRYEFDIDDMFVVKFLNDDKIFNEVIESIDEGLDIIERDIHSILGISEKSKTRGEKYKGRHIPSKYLTRKKKAMKKEIDEFRGKKQYKKDWEADIDRRSGKRIKTKKSESTKAYQRMFGDK